MELNIFELIGFTAINLASFAAPAPIKRSINYRLNESFPNEVLDSGSAGQLARRNIITKGDFEYELKQQGISKERADYLYDLTEQLIDINSLAQLRLRGQITKGEYLNQAWKVGFNIKNAEDIFTLVEQRLPIRNVIAGVWRNINYPGGKEGFKQELRDQGWTDNRINALFKTSEFYPGAADWVYFARRDIFNPKAVEQFGYDESYPQAQEADVAKAGVKPEFWKYYWRAHWRDLGTGEIFLMLHRGIIDDKEALLLLKTSNFAPRLAEKLMKAAYNPYSRVDVRRMYKLGVLTKEEVKRNYQDLGYDELHAQKLADFTEKWAEDSGSANETETDKAKAELKGLTRAAIISEYKGHLLTKDKALSYLETLGLSEVVAEAYLSLADYDNEKSRTSAYTSAIKRMYVNGVIDFNKATDMLNQLNLPADTTSYLLDLWDLDKISTPSQPSKSELERFLKKGIISKETFQDEMSSLGYSDTYIKWYLKDLSIK